jgi:hypothetical protein
MSLAEWLARFVKLHEQARAGAMSDADRSRYLAARDEFARALLKTQRVTLQPGETPRAKLRAALAFSITVQLPDGAFPTITRDISSGGFSIKLMNMPSSSAVVAFSLRLSAKDIVEGNARLVSWVAVEEGRRASFSFDGLAPEVSERIEMAVFDAVVKQLKL